MNDRPVILITGTSAGIGKTLSCHYASNGYVVIGCSRGAADFQCDNYRHVIADITDEQQLKVLFSMIRKEYGRLDVLINNAGLSSANYAMLMTGDHIKAVYQTNVIGTILVTREAVKIMKRNNFGRILTLSSIHVPLATEGTSVYSATKISIEQFGRVLAKEVSAYGITVNSIGLSYVKNSGMAQTISKETETRLQGRMALDMYLNVEDVTYLLDFFMSPRCGFITGQTIYTSGI